MDSVGIALSPLPLICVNFERHTAPLHILFLDRSQAFDSISHQHFRAALIRYGVSGPSTNSVMAWLSTNAPSLSPTSQSILQLSPLAGASPYLFIIVLSALTADLNEIFFTLFNYIPWTFSSLHPSADIEYADDTVSMARSNETFMGLLHLLQHLASRVGLLLSGSKCQLLSIHFPQLVSLSLSASPEQSCDC